jgi:ribosomal protein S18 acetylase RimI-like enzyme
MNIARISQSNRQQINDFISSHWFSTDMVVRGEILDMTLVDGFAIFDDTGIIGLITFRMLDYACEIMSFDSLRENQGIGTALLNKVMETAKNAKCKKIKLITTNDNINALRFYQKRGFDMVHLYHNSIDTARKLKPSIPILGEFNIPLKHEIEFEMQL